MADGIVLLQRFERLLHVGQGVHLAVVNQVIQNLGMAYSSDHGWVVHVLRHVYKTHTSVLPGLHPWSAKQRKAADVIGLNLANYIPCVLTRKRLLKIDAQTWTCVYGISTVIGDCPGNEGIVLFVLLRLLDDLLCDLVDGSLAGLRQRHLEIGGKDRLAGVVAAGRRPHAERVAVDDRFDVGVRGRHPVRILHHVDGILRYVGHLRLDASHDAAQARLLGGRRHVAALAYSAGQAALRPHVLLAKPEEG